VGFSDASFPWAFNHRVGRPLGLHEVDRNLSLLRGLGEEPLGEDRVLHVGYTAREEEAVLAALGRARISPGERVAALCPGSVWPTKRWTAEGFASVAQGLAARGIRTVLLGGPGDAETAARVEQLAALGEKLANAVGQTPLKALAAWMDRVCVLVTNDSAPLHVAAARGTPTVAVFGATAPSLGFGPFHAMSRVVEAPLECRPCGLHGATSCPKRHFRCMAEVSPEAVLSAVDELLEGRP
jgi:heptosyltransferase-2